MKKYGYLNLIWILILVALFLADLSQFSFPLFSQTKEKPLRYEVEVVLIEIPLYVVDKKGNPVIDLKPDEITLTENGKKQKISHFILVQHDSPQIASLVQEYPAARRQFLLFFDFAFATPARISEARKASLDFIQEKILPTDLAAVATYSHMGGLKIIANFSNDREQLFHTINTLGLVESRQRMNGPAGFSFPTFAQTPQDFMARAESTDTIAAAIGAAEFRELLQRTQKQTERIYKGHVADFVSELKKLSIALNTIQGRKHIIYFSEGFDSKVITGKSLHGLSQDSEDFAASGGIPPSDTESRFGDTGLRMKLYNALKMIASADTPIHTIDIGGLRTQAGALTQIDGVARDMTAIRRGQEALTVMSRETGGQTYRNINTLDEPLKNLLKVTNSYYIIGYYPEDTKKKGKFRKIKIKTNRPAVSISYRKGYYEEKPYKEYSNLEKRLQLVEYIVKDIPRGEIQFDSFVSAFRGKEGICQVPVLIKFPGRQFLERRKNIKLEIYGYAISNSGVFKDYFYQTLTISPGKVKKKLELYGIKHFDLNLVPPGDYMIRLIVRDKETGEIGCQTQEISVPDYDKGNLALSGLVFIQPDTGWILSRGYNPKTPTGRKKGVNLPLDYPYVLNNKPFVPGVVPVLNSSSKAQFYLRVYNLRLHPQLQVPQTEMSFEIMDKDGKSTLFRDVNLLQTPTQLEPGVFDFLFQADFLNLAPGPYQLKLSFKDSLATQEVVSKTPFILE